MTWNTPTYSSSDIARMQEAAVHAAREMNRRAQRTQSPESEPSFTRRQNEGWNGWQRREESFAGRNRSGESPRRQPENQPMQGGYPQTGSHATAGQNGSQSRQPGRTTSGYGQNTSDNRRMQRESPPGPRPVENRQQPGQNGPSGRGYSPPGVGTNGNPGNSTGQMPGATPQGEGRNAHGTNAGRQNGAAPAGSPGGGWNSGQPNQWNSAPPPSAGPQYSHGPQPFPSQNFDHSSSGSAPRGPQVNHAPPSGGLFSAGGPLGSLGGMLGSAVSGVTSSLLGDEDTASPISKVLNALNLDTERIIILILALVLLNEKADYTLILALVYLFF
jgi:hypothetical protein